MNKSKKLIKILMCVSFFALMPFPIFSQNEDKECKLLAKYIDDNNTKGLIKYATSHPDANINCKTGKDRETLLMVAIRSGNEDIVDWLIENDVALGTLSAKSESAISIAIQSGNYTLIERLVKQKIELNRPVGKSRKTPFQMAIETKDTEIVRLLVKSQQAKLSYKDHSGDTVLMYAVKIGIEETVSYLLEETEIQNSIINIPNNEGYTPLSVATMMDSKEMVGLLVSKGARKDAGKYDACHFAESETLKEILECY